MIWANKMKGRKIGEFGQVVIRYASAQLLSKGLNMISGFLVIRLLKPEDVGFYNGAGIYLGYIFLGHFGVLNGLGRDLPFYMAKGNESKASSLASSSWVLSVILSSIASIIFILFGIYNFIYQSKIYSLVYFSYAISGFFVLMNSQFLPQLYRTNEDFKSLAKQNSKFGLSNLFTVVLVSIFGFYGLIFRGVFLSIFQFYLLYVNNPIKLNWKYAISDFNELFKTGFPIYLIGHINSLWTTILYQVIFKTGGAVYFGLYSIASIIQGAIGIIPTAFGVITYPRMTTMFANGYLLRDIIISNLKLMIFQFLFLLFTAIIISISLPYFIPIILPKYNDGILAAQWMCFVPVVQSFDSLNNIYNVINKQRMLFFSLLIGAFSGILYTILTIKNVGFSLEVFPKGLLIGVSIQQIFSLFFIWKMAKK
jgi:O-antigen/teichoic acid export membrane protein